MPSQPTFENTSFVATLEQNGDFSSGATTWTDRTGDANLANWIFSGGNFTNPGFTFNFGVNLDSERSLNLAPTIPYTDVNDDLAGTSETDRPWTLSIVAASNTFVAFTLYVMTEPAPVLFASTSHVAHTTNTPAPYLVETFTSASSVWSLFLSGALMTIPIDFSTTLTPVGGTSTTNSINRIIRDPLWNGRLQFFITTSDNTVNTTIGAASFVGQVVPFHTGQMGLDVKRRARVVHDYINGFPYLSDEAVEDPFREGVQVHFSSADPVELRRHFTYVPPASEGIVDDDIGEVE